MFCNERTDVLLLIRNTFSGEYCSDDGVPKFQKLIQNHFEHYLSDLVNYNIKTSWSPIKMLARVHHGSPGFDFLQNKLSVLDVENFQDVAMDCGMQCGLCVFVSIRRVMSSIFKYKTPHCEK